MTSQDKTKFPHEKLPGYHDKPCSMWQRLPYRCDSGGVSPMFLEGIEKYTNHRINGMTPERRRWRKQWLHDQELTHREPVHVPELYRVLNNPIKRFFAYPFDKFESALSRIMSKTAAGGIRTFVVTFLQGTILLYCGTYYFMYNSRDWTTGRKLAYQLSKPVVYPGAPGYPFVSTMKEDDYHHLGFKDSIFYKSEEQIKAEYAAELAAKKAARNK